MTRRRVHDAARSGRRAFALPLAVLLILVVGMLAAIALERFAAQTLSVQRQLRGYREHHVGRGIQEATWVWISRARGPGGNILESLGEDGHAFDLAMPDGTTMRVYLRDGQGTLLTDEFALTEEQAIDVAAALEELALLVPLTQMESYTRSVGPVAVSAGGAPEAVLRAVTRATLEDRREADALVRELLAAREEDGAVSRQEFSAALSRADIAQEDRQAVLRMLVAEPILWRAEVDLLNSGGALIQRYAGLVQIEQSDVMNQGGTFLTFEQIPIE